VSDTTIKNGFDLIDLLGADATREDYEAFIADHQQDNIAIAIAQGILDDSEFWD
jgi:hypothetical protein